MLSFGNFTKLTKQLVRNAYVAPLLDPARAKVILITFLSNFGYGCISFTLNYDMASHGLESSAIYQMARMALMGYACVPLTLWFLARTQSRWGLMMIQFFGVALFFVDRSSAFMNALALALSFSPFLALSNYSLGKNMTKANHGNETALNSYLLIISYSIGLFIGGFLLQQGQYFIAVIGGSFSTVIGTIALHRPVSGRNNIKKIRSLIGWKKPATRISFFMGLLNPLIDGCMPIWMHVMGISALGAGINMSLRPLIGLLLTPLVGWLIQKKGLRAAQLGSGAAVLGWMMLAVSSIFPLLLSFALAVLTTGTNLILPMEIGRWLRRRSSAAVISRELLISSGRIPAYGLGIITCFTMPLAYPILGLMMSSLFVYGMIPKRKGLSRFLPERVI